MMIRPISALVAGLLSGILTEIINPGVSDNYTNWNSQNNKKQNNILYKIFHYAFITLPQDIAKPLVTGICIAALISLFIPNDFFMGKFESSIFEMLSILIISIPLYVCATASIPIAAALMLKGVSAGAVFVFWWFGWFCLYLGFYFYKCLPIRCSNPKVWELAMYLPIQWWTIRNDNLFTWPF